MPAVDKLTSDQIKYCRIICIFFMTIVHIPPGIDNFADFPAHFEPVKVLVNDILGRASVSALSFISGFLLLFSVQRKSWGELFKGKFINLIIPMAFWNCMIICFGYVVLVATGTEIYVLRFLDGLSWYEIISNRIFAIHHGAASDSLNFLRDIFLCILLSPLIIFLAKRLSWCLLIAVVLLDGLTDFLVPFVRSTILIFFIAGIVFGISRNDFSVFAKLRALVYAAFIIIVLVELKVLGLDLIKERMFMYDMLKRLIAALFVLDVALVCARSIQSRLIDRVDAATFFIFLAHNLVFLIPWGVWKALMGEDLEFPYIIFYLGVPLLNVSLLTLIYPYGRFLPRPLQYLVVGSQVRAQRKTAT